MLAGCGALCIIAPGARMHDRKGRLRPLIHCFTPCENLRRWRRATHRENRPKIKVPAQTGSEIAALEACTRSSRTAPRVLIPDFSHHHSANTAYRIGYTQSGPTWQLRRAYGQPSRYSPKKRSKIACKPLFPCR
jgi:hypothetical protein